MNASDLVFLSSPEAMRLAVAWPRLGADKSDSAWSAAAGVSARECRTYACALRANGICTDDGKTDALALKYIAAKMTTWNRPKAKTSD